MNSAQINKQYLSFCLALLLSAGTIAQGISYYSLDVRNVNTLQEGPANTFSFTENFSWLDETQNTETVAGSWAERIWTCTNGAQYASYNNSLNLSNSPLGSVEYKFVIPVDHTQLQSVILNASIRYGIAARVRNADNTIWSTPLFSNNSSTWTVCNSDITSWSWDVSVPGQVTIKIQFKQENGSFAGGIDYFSIRAIGCRGTQIAPSIGPDSRLIITKVYPSQGNLSSTDFTQIANAGYDVAVNCWQVDSNGSPTIPTYLSRAATAGLKTMTWRRGQAVAMTPVPPLIAFESPTYTANQPIKDQDGWTSNYSPGYVDIKINSALGSQVIDFSRATSVYEEVKRDFDNVPNSGKIRVKFNMYYTTDKSGYIKLLDTNSGTIIEFGINKNVDVSGVYWYVKSTGGTVTNQNLPSGARWVEIKIDLDLDSRNANIYWNTIGGSKISLFSSYSINSSQIDKILFGGLKAAGAAFDDFSINIIADDDRFVDEDGTNLPYYRPFSSTGWSSIRDMVVAEANRTAAYPTYKGVCLDFEMYSDDDYKIRGHHGYSETYDDTTFVDFLEDFNISPPFPLPDPNQRKQWLFDYYDSWELVNEYISWQANKVADEVNTLRTAVNAVDPNFQIGIYGWGNLIETVRKKVATASAPTIILNAATYSRDFSYNPNIPDAVALRWAMMTNGQLLRESRNNGYPCVYLSGHNPQIPKCDPNEYKFTARQSFNSAAYAEGYWIWTEWAVLPGWDKQTWIDAIMNYWQAGMTALDVNNTPAWANGQPYLIQDPNKIVQNTIITRNASWAYTAWNPITGDTWAVPGNLPTNFATITRGELNGVSDNYERIKLDNGWVYISDETSLIPLQQFYVGTDKIALLLIGSVAEQALDPSPSNGTKNVNFVPTLSWTAGPNSISHDIYFGTNQTNVTDANHTSVEYKGNQSGVTYAPGTLNSVTTYYWRIDEVGNSGTTKGTVWSFTTDNNRYTECFQEITIGTSSSWTNIDLSSYNGVEANQVVEIGIGNKNKSVYKNGGVRATGSSVDRRTTLHYVDSNGQDMITMQVKTDANKKIQAYATTASDVSFYLIGTWKTGDYTNKCNTLSVNTVGNWTNVDLTSYGVDANNVVELLAANTSPTEPNIAGIRAYGSNNDRKLTLHKTTTGGQDSLVMMVKASANKQIQVYKGGSTVAFILLGYWTTAPGTYIEKFVDVGKPGSDASWTSCSLSGQGAPANAICEMLIASASTSNHNNVGVRKTGSSLSRLFDIHKSSASSARECGMMRVEADSSSNFYQYLQHSGDTVNFYLLGYWN